MSTISASPKDIILAWATPVSLSQLGARLFAYAETKAAITTFRLVTSHANIVLPGELIDMISSKIRDNAFESTIKGWVKVGRCLANTCTTVSHVSRADLDSLAGMVSSNWADNDEWLAGHFAQEAAEAHEKDVMNYCRLLTSLKGKSKLAKCVKVLLHLFHHISILNSN